MKISTIVPVYNTEKYLNKCIDSILKQTYKDFELILVDDGSTDTSGAICDEYAKKDERVVVIHKENGGQATARNIGLDAAKGEYVSFIDSDDYIEPEMYETMISAIETTDAEIAMCGKYLVSEDYSSKSNRFVLDSQNVWEEKDIVKRFLLGDNVGSSPCDKLILKELFEKPEQTRFPSGYICEDLIPIFDVLSKATKLVHVGKAYYNYYQRGNSTSRSKGKVQEKAYGLIKYPAEIRKIVYEKYPEFSIQADYYYAIRLMSMLYKLDPKYNKKECKEYRKELLKYKKLIKKYGSKNDKRLCWLFQMRLYYVVRKIKRMIKGK